MIKATTTTRILAAFMASSIFLSATACSSGPTTPEPTSSTATKYSGVDVFKGVFFHEGPAASPLAELWQARAQELPKSRDQQIAQLEHAIAEMKAAGWSEALIAKAQAALDTIRAGGQPESASAGDAAIARDLLIARINESDPTFFDRFGEEMQSGDHIRVEAAMTDAVERIRTTLNTVGDSHSSYDITLLAVFVVAIAILAAIYVEIAYRIDGVAVSEPSGRLSHAENIDLLTVKLAR